MSRPVEFTTSFFVAAALAASLASPAGTPCAESGPVPYPPGNYPVAQ